MKIREGEIENALIYYHRDDVKGPSRSDVILYHAERGSTLKAILSEAVGVDVVVDKLRDIYVIDNVKVHIDEVGALGSFVEVEAIDEDGSRNEEALRKQCDAYSELFAVRDSDLVSESYSDLLRDDGM